MNISDFNYDLLDERIARFPLTERDASKLLVWKSERRRRDIGNVIFRQNSADAVPSAGFGDEDSTVSTDSPTKQEGVAGALLSRKISETVFGNIGDVLPEGSLLVFNNTRVVRARLVMFKPAAPAATGTHKATGALAVTGPHTAMGTLAATADSPEAPTRGARIEVLCLEPTAPADYERAFTAHGTCEWKCMVGNSKKWKSGPIEIPYIYGDTEHKLSAYRAAGNDSEQIVRFEWDGDLTFGGLLELLGRVPIPPYLGRDSEEIDLARYQTVFARIEGSVAAPTAGLHFTPELLERLKRSDGDNIFRQSDAGVAPTAGSGGEDSTRGTDSPPKQGGATNAPLSRKIETEEVTLHVGAGTFLPVKVENALEHTMHTEHFEVTLAAIEHLISKLGNVVAVGTTSVRTLESLTALAWRIAQTGGPATGNPEPYRPVGQFEPRDIPAEFDGRTALETLAAWMRGGGLDRLRASTQIMISPGFCFRMVSGIVTNFHQPQSTLLLLIAAFTGGGEWRRIYDYALAHDFRFLSYGDSSLLLR